MGWAYGPFVGELGTVNLAFGILGPTPSSDIAIPVALPVLVIATRGHVGRGARAH